MTVVIYDRIRENLGKFHRLNISEIANLSINEPSSYNNNICNYFACIIFNIYFRRRILRILFAMILGVLIGTYSSIFVASPI